MLSAVAFDFSLSFAASLNSLVCLPAASLTYELSKLLIASD